VAWARDYGRAAYCQPAKLLFNVNGPAWNMDPGHLDSPRFRGMGLADTPTWLLSVMGKSGLFQRWAIKMVEVIVWFQKDTQSGGFTYWPDGPLAAPKRLAPPLWNRGVVTQNTAMYHRGESNGPVDQRANPKGLTFDSTFSGDPGDPQRWEVRTGDAVIARYTTDQLRLLFTGRRALRRPHLKRHVDHLDDLTPERVFDTFVADWRGRWFRRRPTPAAIRAAPRAWRARTSVRAATRGDAPVESMPLSTSLGFTAVVHDLSAVGSLRGPWPHAAACA
jgi:hypothetical protein